RTVVAPKPSSAKTWRAASRISSRFCTLVCSRLPSGSARGTGLASNESKTISNRATAGLYRLVTARQFLFRRMVVRSLLYIVGITPPATSYCFHVHEEHGIAPGGRLADPDLGTGRARFKGQVRQTRRRARYGGIGNPSGDP